MKRYRMTCDTCGYTRIYKSAPLAERHFKGHRCNTHLERAVRTERRLAQLQASGERRDCVCTEAQHQHGSRSAYVIDKCRCRPCRDAASAYERKRVRNHLYGRPGSLVDAQSARDHLERLMGQGMGLKQIARVSGIASSSLAGVIYGKSSPNRSEHREPRKRISRDLECRILAVQLDLAAGAVIDGTGTGRRIQALVAVGWSLGRIASALGITRSNFTALAWNRRGVTVATAQAVLHLYEMLWDQPPPSDSAQARAAYSRACRMAKTNGWLKPLELDDDHIDDPYWVPDQTSESTPTNRLVHPEDVEWLHTSGLTCVGIAGRLGVKPKSLQKTLERHGRRDLWVALSTAEQRRRAGSQQVA